MKKLYKNQKHSIYELTKKLELEYKRLYRYADKTVDINKMPIELVLGIANIEKIEPNELFREMKEYLGK